MKRIAVLAGALGTLAATSVAGPAIAGPEAGGDPHRAQIIGGERDRQQGVKWIAAILNRGPGSRFDRQFCGGSLVGGRYVLTAAHCVAGPKRLPRELQVLVGTKDLSRGGTVRNLRSIHVFPGYNRSTDYGDVALLRLARGVGYGPVPLVAAKARAIGRSAYVAGWGSTTGGRSYPTRLRSGFVAVRQGSVCEARYSGPYHPGVQSCAGTTRPNICSGDSGGPLALRVRGRWRLLGVSNLASVPCGTGPGVFAWTGSPRLQGWISSHLDR